MSKIQAIVNKVGDAVDLATDLWDWFNFDISDIKEMLVDLANVKSFMNGAIPVGSHYMVKANVSIPRKVTRKLKAVFN